MSSVTIISVSLVTEGWGNIPSSALLGDSIFVQTSLRVFSHVLRWLRCPEANQPYGAAVYMRDVVMKHPCEVCDCVPLWRWWEWFCFWGTREQASQDWSTVMGQQKWVPAGHTDWPGSHVRRSNVKTKLTQRQSYRYDGNERTGYPRALCRHTRRLKRHQWGQVITLPSSFPNVHNLNSTVMNAKYFWEIHDEASEMFPEEAGCVWHAAHE